MFLAKLMPQRVLSLQARKPSGLIGRFLMANIFKKGNKDLNSFVEETLKLQPSHYVLEVGFGPGELINRMASIITQGHIEGIDFSDVMLNEATRNNKKHIAANRVRIQKGDCGKLNFTDESFDRVCSVNTIYFWNPPNVYLMEIYRVIKSGGQLVLGLRDKEQISRLPIDKSIFNTYTLNEVVELLLSIGFSNVRSLEKEGTPFTSYCVVATKA
ncbi:MAG: class I SAM-dependent methyltransferase [Gammaproteobacteria bacterium]|nr:class I SAM-dependent methyltransferase [Gammaproteobacteria bacterium]